jgi:hypothetical protein
MAVFVCQNSSRNQSAKTCAVLGFETVVALEVEKIFALEAEQRMKAGVNQYSSPTAKMTEGSKGEATEKAAAALKTSATYVKAASCNAHGFSIWQGYAVCLRFACGWSDGWY